MAGQDIQKRLQPGQSQPVQVGGDFIFLKFADRPIVVIINGGESSGSRVIMEAGDKYRPGAFESFEIENTDKERAAQLVMTVGRGDYNRQIIKGEISVTPGFKSEDGQFITDQRSEISAFIQPAYNAGDTAPKVGDLLASGLQETANAYRGVWVINDTINTIRANGGKSFFTLERITYNKELEVIEKYSYPAAVRTSVEYLWSAVDHPDIPGIGLIYVDKRTLGAERGNVWIFNPSTNDREVLFKLNDALNGITYNPNKQQIVLASLENSRLYVCDLSGNLIKTVEASFFSGTNVAAGPMKVAYNEVDDNYTVSIENARDYVVVNNDFTEIQKNRKLIFLPNSAGGNEGCRVQVGLTVYTNPGSTQFNRYQIEEAPPEPLSGTAVMASCGAPMMRKDFADRSTRAKVTVTYKDGKTTIRGEVIKAAIEFYYGKFLKNEPGFNYLDHVYGVYINDTGSLALENRTLTNSETFAAAGIKDSFTAVLPGKITLRVDNNLKFEN